MGQMHHFQKSLLGGLNKNGPIDSQGAAPIGGDFVGVGVVMLKEVCHWGRL